MVDVLFKIFKWPKGNHLSFTKKYRKDNKYSFIVVVSHRLTGTNCILDVECIIFRLFSWIGNALNLTNDDDIPLSFFYLSNSLHFVQNKYVPLVEINNTICHMENNSTIWETYFIIFY